MKKIIPQFISVFLCLVSINGQDEKILQAESQLSNLKGEKKINTLLDLSNQYISDDINKSLKFALIADSLIRKNDNIEINVYTLNTLGKIYRYKRQHSKALLVYNKLLEFSKRKKADKYIGQAYNNIGMVYFNLGRYDKAVENYKRAITIKNELDDKKSSAITLNNLGNAHYYQSNFEKAILNYRKAQAIFEELEFTLGIITTLNGIGLVFESISDFDNAIDSYKEALDLSVIIDNKFEQANLLNNLGNTYSTKKKFDEAINSYNKALQIRKTIGDSAGIASSYNNIGIIYRVKKDYKNAISYYMSALAINKNLKNRYEICLNLHAIGKCYKELSDHYLSLNYLDKSLTIALDHNLNELIYQNYKELSIVYNMLGNYKKAFEYNNTYANIKDTLYNKEIQNKISELHAKYEADKREKEIALLANKNEIHELKLNRNRNFILGLIGLIILVLSIGLLLVKQMKLKERNKLITSEQKLLRSHMNPHFIFNALIAIQSFIFKNNPLEAGKYLSGFAKLMRHILENSTEEYISLSKELDMLTHYLTMQRLRFDEKFDFNFEVSDSIKPELIAIPPMIAQPFVENSIEHGLRTKNEKGMIIIRIKKSNDVLLLEIEDNGIGREASMELNEARPHKSLATTITQERLAIYSQKSHNRINMNIVDLKINDRAVGTKVQLKIPLKHIS